MDMSSTATSSKVSNAAPGTGNGPITLYQEFHDGCLLQYKTITCQEEYRAFSLEEHRLADYSQGKAGPPANANSQLFATGSWNRSPRTDRKKLDLLRGSAIEILVGTPASSNEGTKTSVSNKWSLPKNLISHYSPFLQAACLWDFREYRDERIELPEDDPRIFGLFVEWMYYGSYVISLPTSYPSTDAKCWVLGDKLLCGEFKNYAISRLYEQHIGTSFSKAVSYDDVQYAWDNTTSVAKLRLFYVDFVVQYFASPGRLLGTIEDWDSLLQNHSDIRIFLLENFRQDPSLRTHIKDVKEYLELDTSPLNPILKLNTRVSRLAIREKREESWGLSVGDKVKEKECDSVFKTKDALCTETKLVPTTVGSSAKVHEVRQDFGLDLGSEPARGLSENRAIEDIGVGSDENASSPSNTKGKEVVSRGLSTPAI